MFGHQNNDDQAKAADHGSAAADAALSQPEPETITPTAAVPTASAPTVGDPSVVEPPANEPPASDYVMTDLPHVGGAPAAAAPPTAPAASTPPVTPAHDGAAADDLLELKQSALHELSPLIGHLEQTPEEKFRTTMMMIQASDDQSMLPTALEAAKAIKDEKARAQALLDVVNEINYFTQQHNDSEQ